MIKRETISRLVRVALFAVFLVGVVFAVQLQLGLVDIGQGFGTIGPYNRVLKVVDEIEELELVNSRLRRKLELGFLSTLENFAVTVKNIDGSKAVITFEKGTDEFEETDREKLKDLIIDRAQGGFEIEK